MAIGVIGAGSWGTTLAHVASENTEVVLFTRDAERANEINSMHINGGHVPELTLGTSVRATSDPEELIGVEGVVVAVPSVSFRNTIETFSFLEKSIPFISVTKGLEQSTRFRMSQVVRDADPQRSADCIAVLSGPNLAHEIARGLPAATVVASANDELSAKIQRWFMTSLFRVYTSNDVVGCEIAGVAKNIVAIAVGIGDGMQYGDNAKATVMTRALAEITRLGMAEGGDRSTFSGLAGVGDLIATCASPLSRNRTVGYALGTGKTLAEITAESHDTAEGVFSAVAMSERARELSIDMPIVSAVAQVIATGKASREAVEQLMTRPPTRENS